MPLLDAATTVLALKAAAEPTRLRIIALLSAGELNVSDLTRILGQSQPRISRHLKLLSEAGLIDRFREGSWVYFHLSDRSGVGSLGREIVSALNPADPTLTRDRRRAAEIRAGREAAAQTYFREHAAEWDRIRSLHVAEAAVEQAIVEAVGSEPVSYLIDLGTGTGRMLELLAKRYERGLGVDANQTMLVYARSRLEQAGLAHAVVRHGDIYNLAVDDGRADLVIMHQVLHFMIDPARAIAEAARTLAPGGRLLIVDFAAHDLEELRDLYQHARLGFTGEQVRDWLQQAGLEPLSDPKSPHHDGERLAVCLWQARQPLTLANASKSHLSLEHVGEI